MSISVVAEAVHSTVRRDPTVRFRRIVGAVVLPLGILLQVVTNSMYATLTLSGGSDATGESALALFSSHVQEWRLAMALSMLGSMLIVAGVPAALRVLRPTRPRLSLVAGILLLAGYVAYYGIVASTGLEITLASMNTASMNTVAAAAIDASQDELLTFPFFIVFVVGNIIGTLLLGLAVVLSRRVHWMAGALIMAWPVCHIVGLVVGTEWFAVAGGALETVGLVMLAVVALRTTDGEWANRG